MCRLKRQSPMDSVTTSLSSLKSQILLCPLQIGDLKEEEDSVRPLSGERGAQGGYLLLPPNDRGRRKQLLGHLRKDCRVRLCNSSAAAWGSHWKRPSTRPNAVFRDCPGIARGLRHYAVWRYAVLQTIWAGGLLLWMCVQRGIQRSFEKCVLIWLRNIECIF